MSQPPINLYKEEIKYLNCAFQLLFGVCGVRPLQRPCLRTLSLNMNTNQLCPLHYFTLPAALNAATGHQAQMSL